MTVRPFSLGHCPNVSERDVRATRAALRLISDLPERWSFAAPPLGRGVAAIVGIGATVMDLGAGVLVLSTFTGIEYGRVEIDGVFAALIVEAMLGQGPRPTVRRLGPAEVGVVGGLLGRAFELMGWTLRLGPTPTVARDQVTILMRLALPPVGAGFVHLRLPETVSSCRPEVIEDRRARWARVHVVARVEVAATLVSASAVAALGIGDLVVFEGRQALSPAGESWEARLAIGERTDQFVAPIQIAADGTWTFRDRFSRERSAVTEANVDSSDETLIGSAPIEVVAELGRLTLRGDEAMALVPGAVLAVGGSRSQVTLRVGGQAWAEGEIVNVEGRLGVRVIRVFTPSADGARDRRQL
jgi:flagellar motor switch/type III secretory pathway protein FliN